MSDATPRALRDLIDQDISLASLVPLALELLEQDPQACEGDLLTAVVGSDPVFWLERPDLRKTAEGVLHRAPRQPEGIRPFENWRHYV